MFRHQACTNMPADVNSIKVNITLTWLLDAMTDEEFDMHRYIAS